MRRILKFKSIRDHHTVRKCDDGHDRYGEQTSNRQIVKNLLSKRTMVVLDGKEYRLPTFILDHKATFEERENGKPLGEWRLNDKERLPIDSPEWIEFEEQLMREHSESQLELWHRAQAQFIAQSVEARKQAEAEIEKKNSADVAKVISQMVRSVSAQTTNKVKS